MALLQITLFLLQRRPPFSCGTFSSHSLMHCSWLQLWEGHGKLQSITIVFSSSDPNEITNYTGERKAIQHRRALCTHSLDFNAFLPPLGTSVDVSPGREAAEHSCPPLADKSSATAARPLLVRQAPDCYICLQIPSPVFSFLEPQAAPFDV